jgi:hypothetical protein
MTVPLTDARRRRKTAAFVAGQSKQDQGWLDFARMSTGSTYVGGPTRTIAIAPAGRIGSTGGMVSAGPSPTGSVNSSIVRGPTTGSFNPSTAVPRPACGSIGSAGEMGRSVEVDADTIVPTGLWSRSPRATQTGVPTLGELILCFFIRPAH